MENEQSNDTVSKVLSRSSVSRSRSPLSETAILNETNILTLLLDAVEEHGIASAFFTYENLPLFSERRGQVELSTSKPPQAPLESVLKRLRAKIPLGEDVTLLLQDDGLSLFPPAANEDGEPAPYILTQIYGANGRKGYFLFTLKPDVLTADESTLESIHHCSQITFRKLVPLIERNSKTSRLTRREIEIVRLIAKGRSNPEIAEITNLSVHTVNGYLRGIYLKTQTTNRVSLSFFALHKDLLL